MKVKTDGHEVAAIVVDGLAAGPEKAVPSFQQIAPIGQRKRSFVDNTEALHVAVMAGGESLVVLTVVAMTRYVAWASNERRADKIAYTRRMAEARR